VNDTEEIRRVIAWVLCDAMPPDDELLRKIYADDVSLDSLGATHDELCEIGGNIYEKFNIDVLLEHTASWQTVGDIIRYVAQRTVVP
jgi:acyl carrier protein